MSKKKRLSLAQIDAAAVEAPIDKGELFAEGAAHIADDEKADKKTRKPRKQAAEAVKYPLDLFVNEYGFMRFSKTLLADLGWEAKTRIDVKVTKTATGLAIERA